LYSQGFLGRPIRLQGINPFSPQLNFLKTNTNYKPLEALEIWRILDFEL